MEIGTILIDDFADGGIKEIITFTHRKDLT